MSGFQHYEWQTIDRQLTDSERKAVRELSSHIEVSPGRAVVSYSWGDFEHDPLQVLVRYFDAYLYQTNWGSRQLAFRLPTGALESSAIKPYCIKYMISFKSLAEYDILELDFGDHESDGWVDEKGQLSYLVGLRNDIMQGDYRSLYLAWIKGVSLICNDEESGRECQSSKLDIPPVPPGLRELSSTLEQFTETFDISETLIEAVAEYSPELAEIPETDYLSLVAQLSREQCNELLSRLAQGDTTVAVEVKKLLQSLMPSAPTLSSTHLSPLELLKREKTVREERQQRKAEELRRKHEAEMKNLIGKERKIWQQIAALVAVKKFKQYDEAVELLVKLSQLADYTQTKVKYRQQLDELREQYKRLLSFQDRLERAGLLD